jgi:hypothetical protein
VEDEKKIAESATSLAQSLLGACAQVGRRSPLGGKPLTGGFRIVGVVLREDDSPMANVSIGMLGQECTTNERGEFTLKIEKKS